MIASLISQFAVADTCNKGFLGLPTWYEYLPHPNCSPQLSGINDIWLIVAAVIEILLRVASILAIVYVMYGGFSYITSQGEPDKTAKARSTIVNGLIGLAIAVMAATIIGFIAGSIN